MDAILRMFNKVTELFFGNANYHSKQYIFKSGAEKCNLACNVAVIAF